MKKRVLLAMSGGIDSSVSALLLKKKYEVIGLTFAFDFKNKELIKKSQENIKKAKEVCNFLGIKHYIENIEKQFSKFVVSNFIEAYLSGLTPNPCIECNKYIKFDLLYKMREKYKTDYLATGHYVNIKKEKGNFFLYRGVDEKKDQSYFLYQIKKEVLSGLIFPLGKFTKENIKDMALKNSLPFKNSKESKDICFIPCGSYSLWLKKNKKINNKKGYIKDENGKILGIHNGFFNYTIGQRKGLNISSSKRLYVKKIIADKNEVILSDIEGVKFSKIKIIRINWFLKDLPKIGENFFVQLRYRHKPAIGIIEESSLKEIIFSFKEKQFAITNGQSAVFYKKNKVLGGGIIIETW